MIQKLMDQLSAKQTRVQRSVYVRLFFSIVQNLCFRFVDAD